MSALPAGTVTFVFTDVESSTKLLQAHPRAYAGAIARHHEVLARAVERHGGVVFETVGDAVYAAFAKPADALAAAVDGQRDLLAEPWEGIGALRVRMGMHTGEVEVRGDHYFGAVLYRCARIMSAAHGGQVLLSLATAELVADADAAVALRDLGTHRLKDLQRPEHLLQLVHPDLPSEFPPLRSLNARPNNLPVLRTETVGRERDIEEIGQLLATDDVRLVTLTGAGGIGKTRLALAVGAEALEDFAQGAFAVSLSALRDPALVLPAIAVALGVRETPGRAVRDTVHDYLRDKELLLVLDNCEHLLAAAPAIGDLLSAAPTTKVLAASQAPLRLYGEREFAVSPLAVPAGTDMAVAADSASVRLFVDRARDIRPDFSLTPENTSAVAEICAQLDGLPLAIELAAARIRSLSPQAMLGRLDQRLALLTGGARDLPPRQRTIRGAIEWSYGLLDPIEQLLFARFSVFAGGCALEDAEAVLATDDDERSAMLDGLESLLAKSLIRQDDHGRFSMLATIQEFAHERLEQSGGSRAFRERHARYYADLARRGDVLLHTGEQLAWLDRFDLENDNFRAALDWSFEADGDGALGIALTAALGWYWFLRTRYSEAGPRFERAIRVPGPTAVFAMALVWAAFFASERADGGRALDLARQAVAAARRSGDAVALAYALTLFGFTVEVDAADARASLDEAVATARRSGHDWSLAFALVNAGEVARMREDHDAALRWYAESRTVALRTGERFLLFLSAVNPAHILLKRGDASTARRYLQESLAICRELGNQWGMAYALVGLGGVANAGGRPSDAVRLLGAADAWFKSRGIQIQVPDRPDYERYVEQARASLGEAFADAWRDAHSFSLDDAAAIAG